MSPHAHQTTATPRRPAPRIVLALALVAAASTAASQTPAQVRREVEAIGIVEKLGAEVPREAAFTSAEGHPAPLSSLAGRPVLVSFNYSGCKSLCDLQLAGIARALRDLSWEGAGFDLFTVSIDPAETQEHLRRYKESSVRQAGGTEGVARSWHFVRGAEADVRALAEAAGVRYTFDPRTGAFGHVPTLVVLTGEGRVSAYLHGISPAPEALRTAVARAGAGAVASAAQQASLGGYLLSCLGLDPSDPAPRALRYMRVAGSAAMLSVLVFLGVLFVRERRTRRPRSLRAPPAA